MSIQTVVRTYMKQTGLSSRRFAETLTESLKADLSHVTVLKWRQGGEPSTDFLLQMLCAHSDWRRRFAFECLKAKLPECFLSGQIYQALYELSREEIGNGREEEA